MSMLAIVVPLDRSKTENNTRAMLSHVKKENNIAKNLRRVSFIKMFSPRVFSLTVGVGSGSTLSMSLRPKVAIAARAAM
ncbi:hypothetical protein [Pseudomonas syringae group genomosp. 7]